MTRGRCTVRIGYLEMIADKGVNVQDRVEDPASLRG